MNTDVKDFLAGVKVDYVSLALWNLVMADIKAQAHVAQEKVVHLHDMPDESWELV